MNNLNVYLRFEHRYEDITSYLQANNSDLKIPMTEVS
jgi:hypothetical protein